MGFFKRFGTEFKEFAFKGNVMDLAVGVIIGGAFTSIVNSLVNNIIMPIFGFLTAGMDFNDLRWVLSPAIIKPGTDIIVKPEVAIAYGAFIQSVLSFFIIALCIFFIVRLINKLKKMPSSLGLTQSSQPETPATPPAPTSEELLSEIRDLLKQDLSTQGQLPPTGGPNP